MFAYEKYSRPCCPTETYLFLQRDLQNLAQSGIWQNREVYSYPKETDELHFFSNNTIHDKQAIFIEKNKLAYN